MMECLMFTVGIVAVVGLSIAYMASQQKKKEQEVAAGFANLNDFDATQDVFHEDTGIAIDEDRKKVGLVVDVKTEPKYRVIDYQDVLASEIFKDGESIVKTKRSSQLAGAALGGLAFGGVGAIIGGLSGKKVTKNKVQALGFRIVVNDTSNPSHHVNFLSVKTKEKGMIYEQAKEKAQHWHNVMTVVINQADQEEAQRVGTESSEEVVAETKV